MQICRKKAEKSFKKLWPLAQDFTDYELNFEDDFKILIGLGQGPEPVSFSN